MSFQSNFYLSGRPRGVTPGDEITINTIDKGLSALYKQQDLALQRQEELSIRDRDSQEASSQLIADEIRYQTLELREAIESLSYDVTTRLQAVGDYLGAEIAQVRWALDRNTEITRQILDIQFRSHWHDSRQYYEEGVQCFDAGEKEIAKEQFEKAVAACRTNSFAYQHLGFIAVDADNEQQALRNFELAMKFAPDARQRAYAYYHLARGWFAAGDLRKALEYTRQAIEHDPGSTTYQYELIHALTRTGDYPQAIIELRKLVEQDWNYWSICAGDTLLDPIRADINKLLAQMREEQRIAASNLLDHFKASIELIETFDQATDKTILGDQFSSAKENYSMLTKLYEVGIVFKYRAILRLAPVAHDSLVQKAVTSYESAVKLGHDRLSNAVTEYTSRRNERAELVENIRRRGLEKMLIAANSDKEYRANWSPGCAFTLGAFALIAVLVGVSSVYSMFAEHPLEKSGDLAPLIILGSLGLLIAWASVRPALNLIRIGKGTRRTTESNEGRRLLAEADVASMRRNKENDEADAALDPMKVGFKELESFCRIRIGQLDLRLIEKKLRYISESTAVEEILHEVKSPIIGTFHESPSLGAPKFVQVGDRVKVGQVLCIVEAMNLMNEIESDVAGEIVKRLAWNGNEVGYEQPLFLIRVSS